VRRPTYRAADSAATRLPCSIALLKIALGCPCAVTFLPAGAGRQAQPTGSSVPTRGSAG